MTPLDVDEESAEFADVILGHRSSVQSDEEVEGETYFVGNE